MKKHLRLICTMCLVGTLAFYASSCKKNEEKQIVKVIAPAFYDDGIEFSDDGSKGYIDFSSTGGGNFYWKGGDKIMVYNVDNKGFDNEKGVYECPQSAEGQQETVFNWAGIGADIAGRKDHYFVFYPIARVENTDLNSLPQGNIEYFKVDSIQKFTMAHGVPTVDPDAMAAAYEVSRLNSAFQLKNIFGIMRLRLKSTKGAIVDRIVITDNYRHLTGRVWMKLHEVNMETFESLVDASLYTWANVHNEGTPYNDYYEQWYAYRRQLGYGGQSDKYTVTLDCHSLDAPEGVALTSSFSPFYISLRPGSLIGGFTVDIYYHLPGQPVESSHHTMHNFEDPEVQNNGHDIGNDYCMRPGKIVGFKCSQALD